MSGPSRNLLVMFFLESLCFPRLRLGKHQESGLSGKQTQMTNCFPQNLTLGTCHKLAGGRGGVETEGGSQLFETQKREGS